MGILSKKKPQQAAEPKASLPPPLEPAAPADATESQEPSQLDGTAAPAEAQPTASSPEPDATPQEGKKKKKAFRRPPDVNIPKLPWRQRMSLASMLVWTVLIGILIAGGSAGYYALNVLYRNKLNDTWAILYLELEQKGNRLTQQLEQFAAQRGNPLAIPRRPPDGALHVASAERLIRLLGTFPETMTPKDLNLQTIELRDRFNLLKLSGVNYLALPMREHIASQLLDQRLAPGNYLLFWKIEIDSWLADSADDPEKNTLYVITKEGRVIYSNESEITDATYMKRPLVQKFVANPLRQGQLEFDREDGPAYGFFYEVPNTNLMLFVETSKKVALMTVHEIAVQYGMVFLVILTLAGVLLQFPLAAFIAPIRELVRLAWEVGEGNFQIRARNAGFGELNVLTNAFEEMGKNLVAREERIQLLLIEQQEKFRLADELALAQNIQTNFLISTNLPKSSGLEVATHYSPAAQCAGDWYGYFHDERGGQSVFAIADVSGHGAGSAMFTAIIAALFEETRAAAIATQKPFPLENFAMRLNRLILKLGHGQMHATLIMVRYQTGEEHIEVLNAGHPFPLLVYPEESGRKPKPVIARSDLVGLNADFTVTREQVPFEQGTSILLYTDGLTEGRMDHKLYSDRRLAKTCVIPGHFTVNQLVLKVQEDWQAFLEGQPASDDLCLMAVRRS